MRILADENVEREIVDWLRAEGHDVVWAAETYRGVADSLLVEEAGRDARVLLTHDTDFGELALRFGGSVPGVVLMRFAGVPAADRPGLLLAHWACIEPRAQGNVVVLRPGGMRVRPLSRR